MERKPKYSDLSQVSYRNVNYLYPYLPYDFTQPFNLFASVGIIFMQQSLFLKMCVPILVTESVTP